MRQPTVSEIRYHNVLKLANRSANMEADPMGTVERASKAMTSFYRLAGFSERLFYINNDETLYTRYNRSGRLEEMEAREERWIKRVSGYLKEFNADICFNGIYPSVIEPKTEQGSIVDLNLTSWYN